MPERVPIFQNLRVRGPELGRSTPSPSGDSVHTCYPRPSIYRLCISEVVRSTLHSIFIEIAGEDIWLSFHTKDSWKGSKSSVKRDELLMNMQNSGTGEGLKKHL